MIFPKNLEINFHFDDDLIDLRKRDCSGSLTDYHTQKQSAGVALQASGNEWFACRFCCVSMIYGHSQGITTTPQPGMTGLIDG